MALDLKRVETAPPAPSRRDAARRAPRAEGASGGVPLDDLIVFTRQVSLLIQTGNALVPSVHAFARQVRRPAFKRVLMNVHESLKGGVSLSESLSRHPGVFDRLFVAVMRAGEASGTLQPSLESMAETLESRRRLRNGVREAMTYPMALVGIMCVVVILLITFVLPRFGALFASLGAELPWITRAFLETGDFLRSRWPFLLPIPIVVAVVLRRVGNTDRVRMIRDDLTLRLPVLRRLFTQVYLSQMFLSLGLLIRSRVPLLEAIEITRGTVRSRTYAAFFDELADQVEHGRGLASTFQRASFLPDTVKLMVSTGEASGSLHQVMLRLGDRYREDLESDIRRLSAAIEPFMLVVMGAMVGVIAISLILPLFQLSRALH